MPARSMASYPASVLVRQRRRAARPRTLSTGEAIAVTLHRMRAELDAAREPH